jgi:glyoxylase-like metal-dependent hydrolase (beta-lactamase superfamily II)
MKPNITTINTGGVNCFLLRSDTSCLLIDTGFPEKHAMIEGALADAGCQPDHLKLIVLTHGDVDHAGNAAYLREKYGAPIAIHPDDAGMIESGDMTWNRKPKPDKVAFMFKLLSSFARTPQLEGFAADIILNEGDTLTEYGLEAEIIHLPGHSRGSIGILTGEGDLFCGDLLMNVLRPRLHMMIDDLVAAEASLARLRQRDIRTVYPGHGKPFPMAKLRA